MKLFASAILLAVALVACGDSQPAASGSPSGGQPAPTKTAQEVTTYSRQVGINENCTRAYLAAHANNFPPSDPSGLDDLTKFMKAAPADSLCNK